MRKIICGAILFACSALIAGCGSSLSIPSKVTGKVADGYLRNALVFLDKNGNYKLDAGESFSYTKTGGDFDLYLMSKEIGKYPVVALAVKNVTIDEDSGQPVQNTYVLCTPAGAVAERGTFISPLSTLLREKLEANPEMSIHEALVQLRSQLNMPSGMNIQGDYIAGGQAGAYQAQYRVMHETARQMAALMAARADQVIDVENVYVGRFRGMMGQINQQLPVITDNAARGLGMSSTTMLEMSEQIRTYLATIATTSLSGTYTSLFSNMTSQGAFWRYSGSTMYPMGGMR